MTDQTGERLLVGVFDSVQQAASIVDRLLDGGLAPGVLSALMSDRTAERHFGPPSVRNELGPEGTYSENVNRIARGLRPIAALGTSGAGLVAVGTLAAALVAAGLGAGTGLERALRQLGVDADEAREVVRRVKNGAVLVGAGVEDPARAERVRPLMAHEGALDFQLHLTRPLASPALVKPPQAPIREQRARYEPVIETEDEAGSRTGANRLGS